MPSNFRSNGIDTDDILAPREWFISGSRLFSFGAINSGVLGQNDNLARSSPTQVGTLTDWRQVSASLSHSLAVKTDGTLWSWGSGSSGRLGFPNSSSVSSPTQVGTLTNWKQVSAGGSHSLAVKTDGTLWSWGSNTSGKLGIGLAPAGNDQSSPRQVGALTDWYEVNLFGYGADHSLATKVDGTLWSWGKNNYGQLGLNDIVYRSVPFQLGTLTNWRQVSGSTYHSLSVKTDGTLWSWGQNSGGQLGLNTSYLERRSSPAQIGALTNWKQVSAGRSFSLAVKTDGTLWAWGFGSYGRLGLGTTVNRSSPAQVGALTNWKQVSAGTYHSLAVKTDGTLWSWGRNNIFNTNNGQLGLNDVINRSSPVQVGALTNWYQVSAGRYHSLATSFTTL